MQLSKKMLKISPSGTVILAQKARQLKAEGKDIIELGEGEPDFNTPEFIIKYAYQSAKNGATKYTSVSGTPELKNKITEKLRKENNIKGLYGTRIKWDSRGVFFRFSIILI